jgi:hydrogenase maturation factor
MVGCMMGEVAKEDLVTSGGARINDTVILAGPIAVEGTALLAREAGEELGSKGISQGSLTRARDLLFHPGISVVAAARAAARTGGVTAMHDPTEGGLATGLMELALASGVGLEVEAESIPVLQLTREICVALRLDPLGLIASGSLLIAARPEASEGVVRAVQSAGVSAAVIGRVVPTAGGVTVLTEGARRPLPVFDRDEVARFFEGKQ